MYDHQNSTAARGVATKTPITRGRFFSVLALALLCSLSLSLPGCSSSKANKGGLNGDGDPSLSESDLSRQREGRFGEGGIPIAEGEGMFRDVHFDYDSATISDSARQDLEFNVQVLKDHSDIKIELEGHCDSRGTSEYNLALGARRARSVFDVLVSYGIEPRRLSTISYGAEIPLDQGQGESAWSKNRRVHFSAFTGSGAPKNGSPAKSGGTHATAPNLEGAVGSGGDYQRDTTGGY